MSHLVLTHRAAAALRLLLCAAATGMAAAPPTWADCTARAAKPAEAAFHARAIAALVAALPPLPAGAAEVDAKVFDFKNPPAIYGVLCDFSKEGDFSVSATRKYLRKHSPAERQQLQAQYDALTAQFHALNKTPPDLATEEQALRRKSNAAWQATRHAEKAGDKAAAQARDAEYRVLRDQADAIPDQHAASVKAQTDALDKRRIGINLLEQRVDVVIGMNLQRLPGARADNTSGAYGVASAGKSTGLQVHNVSFGAGGTEGPFRQALAAAIDRAYLQALVGKPLPSQAQSEAYAAKAVPALVPEFTAGAPTLEPASMAPAAVATLARTSTSATSTPTPTADAPPAADPVKKAAEAVNKLRGLFGR